MKAITLQQPWATLVAIGAKRIETRSWRTNYRGPLAITASKAWPHKAQMIALSSPFIERLNRAGYLPDIPLGVVVATCNLVDCLPMEAHICLPGIFDEYPDLDTSQERKFGDFDVIDRRNGRRRWAFVLEDIQPIEKYTPVKGGLGLWNFAGDLTIAADRSQGQAYLLVGVPPKVVREKVDVDFVFDERSKITLEEAIRRGANPPCVHQWHEETVSGTAVMVCSLCGSESNGRPYEERFGL